MILVVCSACSTVVRIMDDADKIRMLVGEASEYWPDKYICVSCGASARGIHEMVVKTESLVQMKVRELSAAEMLAAQSGLGTPDERMCDIATVRELLQQKVKSVHGHTVRGTNRTILTELVLEDGTTLYFGSSSHGAVIYRITRPISYTQKVLEELGQ